MGTILNVAALVSGFGACLAATNGAVRLVFALARDGLGPSRASRGGRVPEWWPWPPAPATRPNT